jgi:hypothetical protein
VAGLTLSVGSLDDLHAAHTAVFFNHPALANNPTTPPDRLRRARTAGNTTHL